MSGSSSRSSMAPDRGHMQNYLARSIDTDTYTDTFTDTDYSETYMPPRDQSFHQEEQNQHFTTL